MPRLILFIIIFLISQTLVAKENNTEISLSDQESNNQSVSRQQQQINISHEFPYEFKTAVTFTGFSFGISTYLISSAINDNLKPFTKKEVQKLDRQDVNSFDRAATYNYSERADSISDITLYSSFASPLLIMIPQAMDGNFKNTGMLGMMYAEGLLITLGMTEITKVTVKRSRPYMYNTSLNVDDRVKLGKSSGSRKSFFSGHTSQSFYNAVFFSTTFQDIYGKSAASYCVWGLGLGLASTTAYLRFAAGKHYPSDIFIGAIVGSSIGYLVPALYRKKQENPVVSIGADRAMISFSF